MTKDEQDEQQLLQKFCPPKVAAEILGMTKGALLARCRRDPTWLAPQYRGPVFEGYSIGELIFLDRQVVEAEARRRGLHPLPYGEEGD